MHIKSTKTGFFGRSVRVAMLELESAITPHPRSMQQRSLGHRAIKGPGSWGTDHRSEKFTDVSLQPQTAAPAEIRSRYFANNNGITMDMLDPRARVGQAFCHGRSPTAQRRAGCEQSLTPSKEMVYMHLQDILEQMAPRATIDCAQVMGFVLGMLIAPLWTSSCRETRRCTPSR